LAFARRQSLKPRTFDVVEQLEGISEMLQSVSGSGITIGIEAPEGRCFVNADPNQLETAVMNMVVNGRDAMQGEGRISITVAPADQIPSTRGHEAAAGAFVRICIEDKGCGIDPAQIDRIFDPFFTTKEVGQGTGLGLSQVFGFAKQSGGEIRVESEPGQGTTFTLYLPRAEADPRDLARPADPGANKPPREGLVLVVEDNINVGEFASELISDLGYRTAWVPTAAAAIEFIDEHSGQVDVVFTDVVMPGMSGVELASRLRGRVPSLPVILTSGYSHVLAEEGSHGFPLVQKPYSAEMVAQALDEALVRSRST
jgi:CheY-like chemotaxis protein/anti-sigma regulatory factor (Ser/Thr protein kinase)